MNDSFKYIRKTSGSWVPSIFWKGLWRMFHYSDVDAIWSQSLISILFLITNWLGVWHSESSCIPIIIKDDIIYGQVHRTVTKRLSCHT